MLELAKQIDEARAIVRSRWPGIPKAGLILGTGLGGLAEQITKTTVISYSEIPHFPRSTVQSHAGQLAPVKAWQELLVGVAVTDEITVDCISTVRTVANVAGRGDFVGIERLIAVRVSANVEALSAIRAVSALGLGARAQEGSRRTR